MKKNIIKEGLIAQKIGNNLAIFDGEQSIVYTLNKIGAQIFKGLKQGESIGFLQKKLANMYDVDEKTIKKDIEDFISDLKKRKIIS